MNKKNFVSDTHPKDYVSFSVLTKQSKDDYDPLMNENLLDDIWWKLFNPSSASGDYDTAIPFRGPPESLQAAKTIVRAEYSKMKLKGLISKFTIEDD